MRPQTTRQPSSSRAKREQIVRQWRHDLATGEVSPRELIVVLHREIANPRLRQRVLQQARWPKGELE